MSPRSVFLSQCSCLFVRRDFEIEIASVVLPLSKFFPSWWCRSVVPRLQQKSSWFALSKKPNSDRVLQWASVPISLRFKGNSMYRALQGTQVMLWWNCNYTCTAPNPAAGREKLRMKPSCCVVSLQVIYQEGKVDAHGQLPVQPLFSSKPWTLIWGEIFNTDYWPLKVSWKLLIP